MAEQESEIQDAPAQTGGGILKKLMLGGVALLLIAIGVFAGPVVMNMISPAPAADAVAADETVEVKDQPSEPALYANLHPPLVVNIKDAAGETHFMQITMEVMARDQALLNLVREHSPVIRNNLILLYSTANYDEATTRAGKEKLIADGLAEIQKIMLETVGDGSVEALYFTSLIIQ